MRSLMLVLLLSPPLWAQQGVVGKVQFTGGTVDPTTKSSREPPPPARSIRTRSMLRLIIFLCLRLLCLLSVLPLPFRLTSGIISVCLDLAGLFRNKDIHLC